MLKLILLIVLVSLSRQDTDLEELLSKMTIEQKCGQMTQVTFDVIQKDGLNLLENPDENPVDLEKLKIAIHERGVGSILNTPFDQAQKSSTWQKIIQSIQEEALNSTLKIPVLYGLDSIHGANYVREATLFPQPLAMASTFNADIAERVGAITAMETKAIGVPWNFNPVLDIGRKPTWPRLWETYGEDPVVGEQMGKAYIKGSQGDDPSNQTKVATCLKHYIGYSYPLNGHDRSAAWIPEMILREYFLPPFAAGVKAGAMTVMVNSGLVNGIPGHANKQFLTDILKGELGFEGFTVSDWEDIKRLHTRDNVAETPQDAVKIAVMAGLDMSMVPYDYSFHDYCVNLAKNNSDFMNRVNDATSRILKVKKFAGLFKNDGNSSLPDENNLNNVNRQDSKDFNLQAARESIVLTKNDGILPLYSNNDMKQVPSISRILVTGPTGNIVRALNGGWSYKWQGDNEDYYTLFGDKKYTLFESLSRNPSINVTFSEGANFTHAVNLEETKIAALNSDIVVLAIGEDTYTEGFGNIDDLSLSDPQYQLANTVMSCGKKVIVVYLGGRPRIITNIANRANAVLVAFLPGNRGAEAITEILFGDYNPSGKLPITYPKSVNGHQNYDIRPLNTYDQYLYPFGHGLSYTTFQYSNLNLSSTSIDRYSTLTVSVNVTNTGLMAGQETVILYLNDNYASVSRQIKQVKGFKKVSLEIGETKKVMFDLNYNDLTFINAEMQRVAEVGGFTVYVDSMEAQFYLESVDMTTTTTTSTTTTTATTTTVSTTTTSIANNTGNASDVTSRTTTVSSEANSLFSFQKMESIFVFLIIVFAKLF